MKLHHSIYGLIAFLFFTTGCFVMNATAWTKGELTYLQECTNHLHSRKECETELLKIRRLEWEDKKTKKLLDNPDKLQ